MHRSTTASIIAINQMIGHFNSNELSTIEALLQEKLQLENKSKMLQLFLFLCKDKLSTTAVNDIYTETVNIWDTKQYGKQQSRSIGSNSMLLKIPNGVTITIGSYLDKKQSITFGLTNRHIYKITQSKSFLLNRKNDPIFILTFEKLQKINDANIHPFTYSMPRRLHVKRFNEHCKTIINPGQIDKYFNDVLTSKTKSWFNGLFSNLDELIGYKITDRVWKHIPMNKLLPIASDKNINCNNINGLILSFEFTYSVGVNGYDDHFGATFENYWNSLSIEEQKRIRRIKTLSCTIGNIYNNMASQLVRYKCIYDCLILKGSSIIQVTSEDMLTNMFHLNLKKLCIMSTSRVESENTSIFHRYNLDAKKRNKDKTEVSTKKLVEKKWKCKKNSSIEELLFSVTYHVGFNLRSILMRELVECGIISNINRLTILLNQYAPPIVGHEPGEEEGVDFDEIITVGPIHHEGTRVYGSLEEDMITVTEWCVGFTRETIISQLKDLSVIKFIVDNDLRHVVKHNYPGANFDRDQARISRRGAAGKHEWIKYSETWQLFKRLNKLLLSDEDIDWIGPDINNGRNGRNGSINKIEIEWLFNKDMWSIASKFNHKKTICDDKCFQSYTKDCEYNIDETNIIIVGQVNHLLSERRLGIIFQNVVDWLNRLFDSLNPNFDHCFPMSRKITLQFV